MQHVGPPELIGKCIELYIGYSFNFEKLEELPGQ